MRRILYLIIMVGFCFTASHAQTALEGKVIDAVSGEPILFGTVALYKNEVLLTGGETDIDGNFYFSGLDAGVYDVEASYVGYTAQRLSGIVIKAGQITRIDMNIAEGVLADEIVIIDYVVPLIDVDNTTSGGTVTAEEIRQLPTKNINQLAATTAGLSSIDGGEISIRGSRSDATVFIVDGIQVSGANIPESEIEQMQVLTGGIPASVGDVSGGAISLTTKGPSNSFSGGLEVESSQFLDNFGYNQFRGNLSGPILKNSDGKSILGFRVSGQYQYREDDGPTALGVYRASAEQIAQLEANPTTTFGGTEFPTAQTFGFDQIPEPLSTRPNEDRTDLNFTGKIDARISDNVDIAITGAYDDSENRFTPSRGDFRTQGVNTWSLLNWTNNPFNNTSGYRGNFRIRHKLGRVTNYDDEDAAKATSSFKNASYTIIAGYERRNSSREDLRHGDNLFRYGSYGTRDRSWTPFANVVSDTSQWAGQCIDADGSGRCFAHQGFQEIDEGFTPNPDINAALARYNDRNGLLFSPLNDVWSNLYSNVGQVYNQFQRGENERLTFNIKSGFDFLPGGSEKGRHSIEFGILYEQRINRNYFLEPRRLLEIAELNANRRIIGVDANTPIDTFVQFIGNGPIEFIEYQTLLDPGEGLFYEKVRDLTGQSLNEYVNVDAINPDDLSLDMFSPGELLDRNIMDYYGYDHLGNKLSGNVSFDDFFSSIDITDGDTTRLFPIAAVQPIYGGAYIQDKFSYKDIIFRLGLRVDYYDANTKVLIDPYSLYEIESAGEFFERTGGNQPIAVEDDYKVYIAGEGSETVVAYREGDNWFLPNGTSVSGGNVIFGGGEVTPALRGITQNPALGEANHIQSEGFDPNSSFRDYNPEVNWMPRLAFSFPISEEAGFFAHYDILVQRPTERTIATAADYFYFEDPTRTPESNPNLRPQKTIDYEVGFQQKLTSNSAVTLSAYYKELRDQIQLRTLANTYPISNYTVFDNLDFGTTKGFQVEYDYRRSANLQFNVNYTLQFADGSGSDANSSRGLNTRGVLRTLNALSFDERHRFNAIIDYRYGSGKSYTGPRLADKNILENFGVNFRLVGVSGRPYTRNRTVVPRGGTGFLGGINEARLPWTFTTDMRINKSFNIGGKEGKKGMYLDVYLRVQNLFDARNVIGVFEFSGDPEDDGYLLSSFGEDQISQVLENGQSVDNFLAAYAWRGLINDHFTLPRRISLGAIVEF